MLPREVLHRADAVEAQTTLSVSAVKVSVDARRIHKHSISRPLFRWISLGRREELADLFRLEPCQGGVMRTSAGGTNDITAEFSYFTASLF